MLGTKNARKNETSHDGVFFFEELQNVEKTCKDSHAKQSCNFDKQAASIKKVEHEVENVSFAVKSLEENSTEVVKACTSKL